MPVFNHANYKGINYYFGNTNELENRTRTNIHTTNTVIFMFMHACILRSPLDSIFDAMLTVFPNKQYRGIFEPTIPATTGPVGKSTKQNVETLVNRIGLRSDIYLVPIKILVYGWLFEIW